jgi:hypothetical protein
MLAGFHFAVHVIDDEQTNRKPVAEQYVDGVMRSTNQQQYDDDYQQWPEYAQEIDTMWSRRVSVREEDAHCAQHRMTGEEHVAAHARCALAKRQHLQH